MKLFEFQIALALPDDADESELLEQVRYFAAELSGDPHTLPARRGQAKAILQTATRIGPDAAETATWNEVACAAVRKSDPLDLFADMRGLVERRQQ